MTTLLLARLAGTQEQMGAQHGRFAADDARRLFGFYRTMPERSLAGSQGERIKNQSPAPQPDMRAFPEFHHQLPRKGARGIHRLRSRPREGAPRSQRPEQLEKARV